MAYGGYLNRGDSYHGKTYVYFATQESGEALYIGMTKCVSTRLGQHKYTATWWDMFSAVGYITCETRELAKHIEKFLIQTHQPIFNTIGK